MNSGAMFTSKTLLITGGTGTFGNAVLRRFLASHIGEIRVFSLDEKKQHDMRLAYNNPKLKFYMATCGGRPVVATPVGAIPEILQFGAARPCGLDVKAEDQVSLRTAIAQLISAPMQVEQLGKQGRCRARAVYGARVVVPRIVDLWRSVAH